MSLPLTAYVPNPNLYPEPDPNPTYRTNPLQPLSSILHTSRAQDRSDQGLKCPGLK